MRFQLICLLVLISNCLLGKSNPYISIHKEEFTINKTNGGFNKTIVVRGAFKETTYSESIYFGELERVESIQAFQRTKKGKIKKVSKDKIYKSDLLSNSFYDGYKAQKIDFEKTNTEDNLQYFEYNASIYNKEIMCLTQLFFYQMEDVIIDTIQYTLHVPKGLKLILNLRDILPTDSIYIDSLVASDEIIYTISRRNCKPHFSYEFDKEPKSKDLYKGLRFIIVPEKEEPYLYFNKWYQTLIGKIPSSTNYKIICDSLSKITSNKDSLIKIAYKYVTQKIKYIDIENGINAFIPRKSDDILFSQQGDCKDMAFLLYNMYKYLGYDANIALSSTLSHDHELDFPSLSSANHSICIVDFNNKRYYLDATEYNGVYNIPSRQIQNTKALISKNNSYELVNIPAQPMEFNLSTYNCSLKIENSKSTGNFTYKYSGYAKLNIEDITKRYSKNKSQQILIKYLQNGNYGLIYNDINFEETNNQLNLKGKLALSSSNITKVENKYYLNLSFAPYAHSHDIEADSTENLVFYSTTKNIFNIDLEFPEEITNLSSPFKNFKIKEKGIEYEFNITYSKNKINISYSYTNPYVKLGSRDVITYNQINRFINSTLNHEIIIN